MNDGFGSRRRRNSQLQGLQVVSSLVSNESKSAGGGQAPYDLPHSDWADPVPLLGTGIRRQAQRTGARSGGRLPETIEPTKLAKASSRRALDGHRRHLEMWRGRRPDGPPETPGRKATMAFCMCPSVNSKPSLGMVAWTVRGAAVGVGIGDEFPCPTHVHPGAIAI